MTSLRNDKKRECRRIKELNKRMNKGMGIKVTNERKIGIKKYKIIKNEIKKGEK